MGTANSIRNGKISSLPASMSKQNTSLENTENWEKFPAGPTPPIPGPILFSVAITELNVVAKSQIGRAHV